MKHKQILLDMYKSMEESVSEPRRTYLGMSTFGSHCKRKQWLEFRHAFDPAPNYQSVSHFFDGHHSEDVLANRLIESGFDLEPVDKDGKQFHYEDFFWLRGNTDGRCRIDNTMYVWECKASNTDKQSKLRKLAEKDESSALQNWDYQYYCQAQLYMGYSGIHKHLLMCTGHGAREQLNNKGDFRTVVIETEFNEDVFSQLKAEAVDIITSDEMPPAAWGLELEKPLCKWKTGQCEAFDYCKGRKIGKPNCRNCGYVQFTTEGATCTLENKSLNEKEMVDFKPCHRYHPNLVIGYDLVSVDEDKMIYRNDAGHEIVNHNSMDFYYEFNKE